MYNKHVNARKILVPVLTAFLLAGCSTYQGDLQSELNHRLASAEEKPILGAEYNHRFYSYYLEPDVGRMGTSLTSNTFCFEGTKFVMNLNVPSVINAAYYTSESDPSGAITGGTELAKSEGTYLDRDGNEHSVSVGIYLLKSEVFTYLVSDTAEFFAVSASELAAAQIAGKMLTLARGLEVNNSVVLSTFSMRQTISYSRKKLELFQNIAPESGTITELFEDSGYDSSVDYAGDNFDAEEDENIQQGDADDQVNGEEVTGANEEQDAEASPSASAESAS